MASSTEFSLQYGQRNALTWHVAGVAKILKQLRIGLERSQWAGWRVVRAEACGWAGIR